MDRTMLQEHVAIAERYIAEGMTLTGPAQPQYDGRGGRAGGNEGNPDPHIDDRHRILRALGQ
jgi:hypothetical protein